MHVRTADPMECSRSGVRVLKTSYSTPDSGEHHFPLHLFRPQTRLISLRTGGVCPSVHFFVYATFEVLTIFKLRQGPSSSVKFRRTLK